MMYKELLVIFLLAAMPLARAQGLPESVLPFIPKGWVALAQAWGDLNKDSKPDLAVVIQNTDPKNTIVNDGLGIDTLDANPRSLLIFFKDSLNDQYKLIAKNDSFVLKHDDPMMDDPFSGIGSRTAASSFPSGFFIMRAAGIHPVMFIFSGIKKTSSC